MTKNDFRFRYIKVLESISRETGRDMLDVFGAFVKMSACALSLGMREDEYREEAKRWDVKYLKMFSCAFGELVAEMEKMPYVDILGDYYLSLKGRSVRAKGEFYTPKGVCDLIAKLVGCGGGYPIELCEPSCGAGQMILSVAQELVNKGKSPYVLRVVARLGESPGLLFQ
jgi:type I restriction-modification system DNA methylase subunit